MAHRGERRVPAQRWGIPTMHKGFQFRSRLEARWAVMFDQLKWRWTHEPYDYRGYIPDFLVHGDLPILVEVRPTATELDYIAVARELDMRLPVNEWMGDTLIVGVDWYMDAFSTGELARKYRMGALRRRPELPLSWDAAVWVWCIECERVAIAANDDADRARPCGHSYGRTRVKDAWPNGFSGWLENYWATACNMTQWQPRC